MWQRIHRKKHLDSHILNNHVENCSTCQYKTYHISNYNQHLNIHYEIKPFVVRSGKGFAAKAHLDSHILNNHIDNVLLMKSITNKIHSYPHWDYLLGI
nr:unnamed protein product [Callosobruchus analis]